MVPSSFYNRFSGAFADPDDGSPRLVATTSAEPPTFVTVGGFKEVETLGYTVAINGHDYTYGYRFDSTAPLPENERTWTMTTPEGDASTGLRTVTTSLDEVGRVIQEKLSGLTPVKYSYYPDSHAHAGRLSSVVQDPSGPSQPPRQSSTMTRGTCTK